MSSMHDTKDGLLNLSQFLVIDEEIKIESGPIIKAEQNHIEEDTVEIPVKKTTVGDAGLWLDHFSQYGGPTMIQKMKILITAYFTRTESYDPLFSEMEFFNSDDILSGIFHVYNSIYIHVYIQNSDIETSITVVESDYYHVNRKFVVLPNYMPPVFNPILISKMLNQLQNCFHPFIMEMLDGKRPRLRTPIYSKPVF